MAAPRTLSVWMAASLFALVGASEPTPWAVEVMSYNSGSLNPAEGWVLLYTDSDSALGRPTVYTYKESDGLDDPPLVSVVPLYPAWDPTELVTVGQGGELVLRMGTPIRNDPANPYGVDFLVFGNSMFSPQAGGLYDVEANSPEGYTLSNTITTKPGVVAVSADAVVWYEFTQGPFVGGMLPTLGHIWTGESWGEETDPTLPPDPALRVADLAGMSLVELIRRYRGGAGGTGFDLSNLAVPQGQTLPEEFKYVRVRCLDLSPIFFERTEIDAVTVVRPVSDFVRWQRQHFVWTRDPSDEAPTANPDGDAEDNWKEFAKGGDPIVTEAPLPSPRILLANDGSLVLESGEAEAWQAEATSTPGDVESWVPVTLPETVAEGARLYRLRLKEAP